MDHYDQPKWYLAILVVTSRIGDAAESRRLNDLQFRLVRAADHEEAYQRALSFGAEENCDYENSVGERVCWEFAGLHDLVEIGDGSLDDGLEVYSRMLEGSPSELVVPKEQLAVYWFEANKDRAAAEILGENA